ncbi:bile acid:sodium symporter family protein [Polaromonas sp. C04]|uniref:bile acid:sodium symporter family protein n=1 Tax=Polaromonas sp. C04 TaxID=1945857 RepID=UPI000986AB58|nr:bile acid:sodium symporter family protein [Polaromonas sp. C04]OOG58748.1 bile acid:sodium symporter [Polaromonas sp. C04]
MFQPRFLPDNFTLALVATVALASVWPARGALGADFETLTAVAIGLLFFLHGAKLSREAIIAGATHWRLHLLVLASTFGLFPVLGLALKPLLAPLVTPDLYLGVLFLCMLPATVQSAIAFTSIARGNVAAAVCSASASTLIGIFITPVLVSLFVVPHRAGAASAWSSIGHIMLQLMAPFVAGQLLRGWIHPWLARHGGALKFVDQGSILLVVYTAFSAAVVQGLWKQVSFSSLAGLLGVCAVLLALMLGLTGWSARRLGFTKEDEITIVFCGSKKSLASGIPMAKVLFASGAVGAVVLPLMLFHQIQLMVCAVLARRYARRAHAASAQDAVATPSR